MPKYQVTFFVTSDKRHSNYVIKGLLELKEQGIIALHFKPAPYMQKNRVNVGEGDSITRSFRPYPWAPELKIEEVETGKEVRIAVDLQDWDTMFSYHSLEHCTVIFKRAFTQYSTKVSELFKTMILPAGINHSAVIASEEYERAYRKHFRKHRFLYALGNPGELLRYLKAKIAPQKSNAESEEPSGDPVVYLTTPPSTPYVFFQVEFHNWNNKESIRINKTRAAIIRTLRKELGDVFVGGMYFKKRIDPSYADCITNVPFQRDIYLKFVQEASVVICSNGFGDSIPWKLPEYLQLGKCIVAEPLVHAVPRPFTENELLFFKEIGDCAGLCKQLLSNAAQRRQMGENAKVYYDKNIQPANSVLRMMEEGLRMKNEE
jgi:hypothetical protein